ncbi:MAG: DegT/DnrJ/EryC1/StrS family aminotransferase, partial [Microthrixaceae bacterium]
LRYRALVAEVPGIRLVPAELPDGGADHLMMVLLPEGSVRADVQRRLSDVSIGSSVHFRPLHTFSWFAEQDLHPGPGGTPVADTYVDRALSLPFHTRLSDEDVDRVVAMLAQALDG